MVGKQVARWGGVGGVTAKVVECQEGEEGRDVERERGGGSEGSTSGDAEDSGTRRVFFVRYFIQG